MESSRPPYPAQILRHRNIVQRIVTPVRHAGKGQTASFPAGRLAVPRRQYDRVSDEARFERHPG
jgi:hypothetical protein